MLEQGSDEPLFARILTDVRQLEQEFKTNPRTAMGDRLKRMSVDSLTTILDATRHRKDDHTANQITKGAFVDQMAAVDRIRTILGHAVETMRACISYGVALQYYSDGGLDTASLSSDITEALVEAAKRDAIEQGALARATASASSDPLSTRSAMDTDLSAKMQIGR
jgi:hypothetical protein